MKKFLILLLVSMAVVAGCAKKQPCLIRIIDTYQKDIEANDGVLKRAWKTVIELPNNSRCIADGKYGKTGDSFWAIVRQSSLSECYIGLVEIEEDK